jgi:hypothetical protein
MAQTHAAAAKPRQTHTITAVLLALAASCGAAPLLAQSFPVLPQQRSTAQQVAQAGVPLADLAPNAPDNYTVKRGDTLWAISSIFLTSAWRWPELWGMNMAEVRNPHLIYPGQTLYLEKKDGRALLRMQQASTGQIPEGTVRLSPRTRSEPMVDQSLPTLQTHLIEPFLSEPVILQEGVLERAPRIVATTDSRVLITRGDRAYVRGSSTPFVESTPGRSEDFRVFRTAKPLRDPITQAVLGYEAQYLGKALLVRSESIQPVAAAGGKTVATPVPATVDIVFAREEMRVGDRLLPEPPRELVSYVPRAPSQQVEGSVVSIYGDAVAQAGQNKVVTINKGTADGMEPGHVLAILKTGARLLDRSQPGERVQIKLPDERNGLMMVFRTFERVSYALVLEIADGVKVGDTVVNPR